MKNAHVSQRIDAENSRFSITPTHPNIYPDTHNVSLLMQFDGITNRFHFSLLSQVFEERRKLLAKWVS